MARQIRSANSASIAVNTTQPDDFKDRLVKLIPTEIVTAYITIQGLMSAAAAKGTVAGNAPAQTGDTETLLWIVFGVLTFLTPVYLYYISKVSKWLQIVFTTVAFVIWVTVIGGPIDTILGFPAAFIGSIILVIYTLFIPLVYKG